MKKIKLGKYRHFKGGEYEVIGIGKHSETIEEFVVYKALYDEGQIWIRPKNNFLEVIVRGGRKIPRFKYVYVNN